MYTARKSSKHINCPHTQNANYMSLNDGPKSWKAREEDERRQRRRREIQCLPPRTETFNHGQILALTEGYPVGTGEFALAVRNESNPTHGAAKHS